MVKNIIIGALAGAAVAYLLVEKNNHRQYEELMDHANQFIHKMKRKMAHGFDKGKGRAQCMSNRASEYLHHTMPH